MSSSHACSRASVTFALCLASCAQPARHHPALRAQAQVRVPNALRPQAFVGCAGACPGWARMVFAWHDTRIEAVDWNLEHGVAISASHDQTLRGWSLPDVSPTFVLPLAVKRGLRLALRADAMQALLLDEGKLTRVDLAQETMHPFGPDGGVTAFAWCGEHVVAVHGAQLRAFDVSGAATWSLAMDADVGAVACTRDGHALAVVATKDKKASARWAALPDATAPTFTQTWVLPQWPFDTNQPPPRVVTFSGDGTTLAVGDHALWVLHVNDVQTGPVFVPPTGVTRDNIDALSLAQDGSVAMFVGSHRLMGRWNLSDAKPTFAPVPTGFVSAAATDAQRKRVFYGRITGALIDMNLARDTVMGTQAGFDTGVTTLSFHPTEPWLYAGYAESGMVERWALVQGTDGASTFQRSIQRKPHAAEVNAMAWFQPSDAAPLLVVAGEDGRMSALESLSLQTRMELRPQGGAAVLRMDMCATKGHVALGLDDGSVEVWDVRSAKQVAARTLAKKPMFGVAFAPDCATLAAVGEDGYIRLLDAATLALRKETRTPQGPRALQDVVFVADHDVWTAEAFGGNDPVRVFSFAEEGKHLGERAKTAYGVASLERVRVHGVDAVLAPEMGGGARLWALANGRELAHFPAYEGMSLAAAMSPDGHIVAVGSMGKEAMMRVWMWTGARE